MSQAWWTPKKSRPFNPTPDIPALTIGCAPSGKTPMTTDRSLRFRCPAVAALLLALAFIATACSHQGSADSANSETTLVTVSAYAEARRAPDVATLSTGVVSLAPDANAAIRRNAEQMSRVVAAIRKAGIADKDVQTSGVSLNPDYHYLANR